MEERKSIDLSRAPIPELVDTRKARKAWSVFSSGSQEACVDKRENVLIVPDPDSPGFRSASRHELGHVRLSPVAPPEVDFDPQSVQVLEDCRVNGAIARAGAPYVFDPRSRALVSEFFRHERTDDPVGYVYRAIACAGVEGGQAFAREALLALPNAGLRSIGLRWLDRVDTLFGGTTRRTPGFNVVYLEASRLAAELACEVRRQAEQCPPIARPGSQPDGDEPGLAPAFPVPQPGAIRLVAIGALTAAQPDGDEVAPAEHCEPSFGSEDTAKRGVKTDADRVSLRGVGLDRAMKRVAASGVPDLNRPSFDAARGSLQRHIVEGMLERARFEREQAAMAAKQRFGSARIPLNRVGLTEGAVFYGNAGRDDVGDLWVETPRLDVPQRELAARGARKPRSATTGTMIRRPDRYAIDGAVFARRSDAPGVTVLLDQSGSMDISVSEVEALCLTAARGATVATYSGEGTHGVLRIVARGDYRASVEWIRPRYGGNTVDYAALRWLASRPGRRMWVTDWGVTGLNDIRTMGLLTACEDVVQDAGIEVVESVARALVALRSR